MKNKKIVKENLNNFLVPTSITIRNAMKIIEKISIKCLIVIDSNNTLLGTLTDGDIRRAILYEKQFDDKIESIFFKSPYFVCEDNVVEEDIKKQIIENGYDIVPLVNQQSVVTDYLSYDLLDEFLLKHKFDYDNVSVVIMAGGEGVRMEPFTKILPKPLIPIKDKTIIERIIEKFTNISCVDFHITVNYKSKIIKAYFSELSHDYNINFINEKKPLGTAGSLYFLKNKFKDPFFVTNCDILIKHDYGNIYNYHIQNNYDITLVGAEKEYIIPYGNCQVGKDGLLSKVTERPKYDFIINTGLYVLSPDVLKLIPKDKFFHITDLIKEAQKNKKRVGVFSVNSDSWIDIGQWEEYRKAIKNL